MIHSPSDTTLAWAVDVLCPSGQLTEVRDLHEGVGPWLVQCTESSESSQCFGILRVAGADGQGKDGTYVRTEAAALRTAERFEISSPRLLGLDAEGHQAGRVASVQSVLAGEPIAGGAYSTLRLRSLGARLARVHGVGIESSTALPTRKWAMDPGVGFLYERRRYAGSPRWAAGERLLRQADDTLARIPRPRDRAGLVHGDAWLGNAMAVDEECTGLFDWGCAGVGHPGVDLGYTRLSAVLTYGMDAADEILAGWESENGEPLGSLAYWDVVAALTTPPDIGTPTDRRDAFLLRALEALQL
ncbi:aminoglycoside phosphotransferase family protein [Actinopolymorpha sp. B9G3]|uniref:phosphotransferase family protein n=1 Tax=Actinopolymorpha sp. B9G3 TaxID=3158970 RepID=UPI0032D94030